MLVLSRRMGESVVIGSEVVVTVVAVSGKGVRLGVTAPETIAIRRSECTAFWEETPAERQMQQASRRVLAPV